jgi:hypothetical protein
VVRFRAGAFVCDRRPGTAAGGERRTWRSGGFAGATLAFRSTSDAPKGARARMAIHTSRADRWTLAHAPAAECRRTVLHASETGFLGIAAAAPSAVHAMAAAIAARRRCPRPIARGRPGRPVNAPMGWPDAEPGRAVRQGGSAGRSFRHAGQRSRSPGAGECSEPQLAHATTAGALVFIRAM